VNKNILVYVIVFFLLVVGVQAWNIDVYEYGSSWVIINWTGINETTMNNSICTHYNMSGAVTSANVTDIWINESGDTMTGTLNMSDNKITDVGKLIVTGFSQQRDIIPETHGLYSLGNSTHWWKTAYIKTLENLSVTNLLNTTGATLYFDNDSIAESDINFSTACGSGNHLYINGNDLACEADAGTTYTSDEDYINLVGTQFVFNEAVLNATIDARAATITDIWVNETGDTMTGALTMEHQIVLNNDQANITRSGNSGFRIDGSDNVIIWI
jgi:hypothetical protein